MRHSPPDARPVRGAILLKCTVNQRISAILGGSARLDCYEVVVVSRGGVRPYQPAGGESWRKAPPGRHREDEKSVGGLARARRRADFNVWN